MRWLVVLMVLVTAGCGTPASGSSGPDRVTMRGLTVESVPADAGFWATTTRGEHLWVKLELPGRASMPVQAGEHVDVTGVMTPHGPDFAAREGVTVRRDLLTRLGTHLEAEQADVRVVAVRHEPARLGI